MAREGRPLKFNSVEELETKISEYFEITPMDEWMITGMAVHLDTSRNVLCDYESSDGFKGEFSNTIKRAKEKIEMAYEKRGLKVGNAFDIFRLKNMGWSDRQEIEHSGEVTENQNIKLDKESEDILNELIEKRKEKI